MSNQNYTHVQELLPELNIVLTLFCIKVLLPPPVVFPFSRFL